MIVTKLNSEDCARQVKLEARSTPSSVRGLRAATAAVVTSFDHHQLKA